MACSLAQRIFKDMTSYSDDEQERITDGPGYEIVIRGDGAYEVIRNLSGTETLVPNVPDFKFGHSVDESDSEAVPCKKHVQEGVCDTDMTIKIRTRPANEFTDEKYEEHFDIDRSVYDQSGCKIMPRSCKKVNPRVLEQKDKKKTKTKGVANKHLMKAFNDADQSQEYYDDENENELRPLKELDELENDNNNEFENGNVDIEDENKHSTKVNEIRAESEPENPGVNVSYVEDMRHWQMLPTEVRRKYDDENNFDDKYSMSSKGTPEDKKKGKKKKQKKQKAQPLSLLELNFQFQ